MAIERFLEDFQAGEAFTSQSVTLDAAMIKSFAAQFDPQPQHLDEAAAARSFFGGLVASGWHTAALTIKLIVESELKIAGGLVGSGLDEFQWYRPVRPGDSLRVEFEVLEIRQSLSRKDQGLVRLKIATLNQTGSPVLTLIASLIVPRRPQKPA
ncbi:MAG: MaoC family dehydratase [Planctomycetia bacterium]|nr:MaoC family dehydratase [Planctomycetia bacterium]